MKSIPRPRPRRDRPAFPRTDPRHGTLVAAALALLLAAPLHATDGASGDGSGGGGDGTSAGTSSLSFSGASLTPSGTYYEQTLGGVEAEPWTDPDGSLPTDLHVAIGEAQVAYRLLGDAPPTWEVRIDGFARRHETVDAVYDMILVLPLPEGPAGGDGFRALGRGVELLQGSPGNEVSLVYGGEVLRLKRNVALEKTLLRRWVDGGSLPALEGSGYRYTAWDTIVTRDPHAGDTLRGSARLRFTTAGDVVAPDAGDPRFAAFWVTWIPSLRAEIAPYAVRMDVVPALP